MTIIVASRGKILETNKTIKNLCSSVFCSYTLKLPDAYAEQTHEFLMRMLSVRMSS
jgi:hypothetical protein